MDECGGVTACVNWHRHRATRETLPATRNSSTKAPPQHHWLDQATGWYTGPSILDMLNFVPGGVKKCICIFYHFSTLVQGIKLFPPRRQRDRYSIWSLPWLLMTWWLKEPEHLEAWYLPSFPWIFPGFSTKCCRLIVTSFFFGTLVNFSATYVQNVLHWVMFLTNCVIKRFSLQVKNIYSFTLACWLGNLLHCTCNFLSFGKLYCT